MGRRIPRPEGMSREQFIKSELAKTIPERINKNGTWKGTHPTCIETHKKNVWIAQMAKIKENILRGTSSDVTIYEWIVKIMTSAEPEVKKELDEFLEEIDWYCCPMCLKPFLAVREEGYEHYKNDEFTYCEHDKLMHLSTSYVGELVK